MCCGIFTHLDAVTCDECRTAHYCSKLCLKHHARSHEKDCKRLDWKLKSEQAAAARKKRLEAYESNVKAEVEAERAKEVARKKMAQKERERKMALGEKEYSIPGESHKQKAKTERPPKPIDEQMAQLRFREERPFRAAAFDAKQQREHEERARCPHICGVAA